MAVVVLVLAVEHLEAVAARDAPLQVEVVEGDLDDLVDHDARDVVLEAGLVEALEEPQPAAAGSSSSSSSSSAAGALRCGGATETKSLRSLTAAMATDRLAVIEHGAQQRRRPGARRPTGRTGA